MTNIALLKISCETGECSNNPRDYIDLQETKIFNSEEDLIKYFDKEFIGNYRKVDKTSKEYNEYKKFITDSCSFINRFPGCRCDCCGIIYKYGDPQNISMALTRCSDYDSINKILDKLFGYNEENDDEENDEDDEEDDE
jgi:hypothetical protein